MFGASDGGGWIDGGAGDVVTAAQPGRRSVRWHQPRPTVATSKMETPDFTVILAIAGGLRCRCRRVAYAVRIGGIYSNGERTRANESLNQQLLQVVSERSTAQMKYCM
jgi:hypothetical protein